MDIKEVGKAMQQIEFILFTLKNGDVGKLRAGEAELAHKQAQEIIEQYLLPLGAFSEEAQPKILYLLNDRGIPFKAQMFFEGEQYGSYGKIHNEADPLIEFTDARNGKMIQRYFASTLLEGEQDGRGLCLAGSANWYLTSDNMKQVYHFVKGRIHDRKGVK